MSITNQPGESSSGSTFAGTNDAPWAPTLGAIVEPGGVRFRIWAPTTSRAEVVIYHDDGEVASLLAPESGGYHSGVVPTASAGARYRLRLDGTLYPDPASRCQPEGVHGPSEVVDPDAFRWSDASWKGITLDALSIYELHIGTFTERGTFDSAIERLADIAALGVTAIEVMPIGSFSGARNWGYDGVALYAPAAPYGGPEGFRRFVDAAHARGLGVILDVVYNHFGPEGNYLPAITGGRFFTDRHKTPWGDAINYDGPDSDAVREFVLQNALHWAHEFHVDGLRLDATHAIIDESPVHLLQELATQLHGLDRPRLLIAEDERNERRVVLPTEAGGYGLNAVWADDFHHQVRRLTAGDSEGYFRSYTGSIADVVTTLEKGWFYEGQWAEHHEAERGTPAAGLPPGAFVHCIQNHDQVGNRALGDRITEGVPLPVYRALTAMLLVSPYTPMLWMGQEWAAGSPFQFFTDHPEELGRLVTEGRREEFKHFSAFADESTRARIPDPQAERTFTDSKLRWHERERAPHRGILELHRELLRMRREEPALRNPARAGFAVAALGDRTLAIRRSADSAEALIAVIHFGEALELDLGAATVTQPAPATRWAPAVWTEDERFGGAGRGDVAGRDGATLVLSGPGAVILRAVR